MPILDKLTQLLSDLSKLVPNEAAQKALRETDPEKYKQYLKLLDEAYGSKVNRAEQMGFGKDTWYHGSPTGTIEDFKYSDINNDHPASFFAQDPKFAEQFATREFGDDVLEEGTVYPVKISPKNTFDYENPEHLKDIITKLENSPEFKNNIKFNGQVDRTGYYKKNIKDGNWGTIEDGRIQDLIQDSGYDSYFLKENNNKNIALKDPSQIRSINAAFDPRFKDSKNILAGLGAGAVGLGVLAAPTEEAEAGPLSDILKEFIQKYPNKAQLKNVLEEMYKSPMLKNRAFLRDEYGDFVIEELKRRHPELNKIDLNNPNTILDADQYVQNQLGTNLNTRIINSKDIPTDPILKEQMLTEMKKSFPNLSNDEILNKFNRELKSLETAKAFTFGDNNYIIADKNKDINNILQSLVHEPYHKLDSMSDKTIKNYVYNPDTTKLSTEGKLVLQQNKPGLLSDTQRSIPEDTGGIWLDWNAIDRKRLAPNILARENPELFEDYVKTISESLLDPGETASLRDLKKKKFLEMTENQRKQMWNLENKADKLKHEKLLEMYPEYKIIQPSVAHSTNMYKGIEKTLADDLLLKDIDPLSKERAADIISKPNMQKVAGAAGIAALAGNNANASVKNISEEQISPLPKLKELFKAYKQNVSEPAAEYLKKQMTPELTIGDKKYQTSSPVTDVGIDLVSDPMNYIEGAPGVGLGLLDFLSNMSSKESK